MKELLSYLYRRNKDNLKMACKGCIVTGIFMIVAIWVVFLLPTELDYTCVNCWEIPIILIVGVGMIFFISVIPECPVDTFRVIRFKKCFGFYPAITDEERSVTLLRIDDHMKGVAAELRYAYSEKDIALHNFEKAVASASSGQTSLDLDRLSKLEELAMLKKESSMRLKEKFYRDIKIAKKLGFPVRSSFKDYQTEW